MKIVFYSYSDTRIILQSGVPSLYQVLNRVKGKLEAFSSTCPEYVQLCNRANQFLLQREMEPVEPTKGETEFNLKNIETKIRQTKDEAEKVRKINEALSLFEN